MAMPTHPDEPSATPIEPTATEPPPVISIVGPTAVGKSDLALFLAEALGGEIINADALQVYRGLDLGTAKPTREERERVRHHLVDILDPDQRYSAGEFARRAREAIDDIRGRGLRPLVVGGSGLYQRALLEGISPVPPGDPKVRAVLRQRLEEEGLEALRRELAEVDPETHERLAPGDTQRVLRALEVAVVSGQALSAWIAQQPYGERSLPALRLGLTLPRPILYDRIERRIALMVEQGWVREVAGLMQRGTRPDQPAFQAIGYRQLAGHLQGDCTFDEAIHDTVRATRRYAKRQLTWFRKEPRIRWFDAREARLRASSLFGLHHFEGFPRGTHG